ncbi:TIGR03943 family putative permease subunit [Butyrivibrio sp. NC3005]|uniref:TIGR03943 family putative permease subunit n=1 Tax=Butyrivibrio sp. NC3005 TaxID=1280685 RepID=UPI000424CB80|nr:GTP-binding protein [Butyrivibrio sp. NC3005]
MKPVYILYGFLESGKTDFLRYTIAQPYFKINGKTLLIVCEEGEDEYEEKVLRANDTIKVVIDDEENFTIGKLTNLENQYNPDRILIEFNGMWDSRKIQLPKSWQIEQQITMINCMTFEMYFNNMKSMLAEHIRRADLILFNRCDGLNEKLPVYKRNVKAINQAADIIFEDKNGEVDVTLDEDLPFDLKADPIELNNYGYGMFYLDALEHVDRYEGKNVKFRAMVAKPPEFPKTRFVPGRMSMTCCAQDMQFLGFACDYDRASELEEKSWVDVTARIEREFVKEYGGEGPVLKAISVIPSSEPESPVIDFSQPIMSE